MNYKKLLGVAISAIAFFGVVSQASAEVIKLGIENPTPTQYQQTSNTPCVIGDASCNGGKALLEFITITPSSTYPQASLQYAATDIRAIVGDVFFIGIDLNITGSGGLTETLLYFDMTVNGDPVFVYTGPTLLGTVNFGNGYADTLLTGFSLKGLTSEDIIQFHVNMQNTTAGAEQYFLIADSSFNPGGNPVPEPGTTAILGLGLLGMGFVSLRGRKKQS